jgi:hypothetical protein
MSHSTTTLCALGLALLVTVCGACASRLMSKEIEIRDPDTFRTIGRPALFARRSICDDYRFARFIWPREYNSIASEKIRLLGNIVFLCTCINVVIVIYLFLFRSNDFRGFAY